MFQIKGPILTATAMDLEKGSDELLRQADALARSYKVKLSVCPVLPEIFAVRPLFPQLHLGNAASELPAQLLVMGTHGRTGLNRLIALGSVAEAVVRAAPCSVLVVRLV